MKLDFLHNISSTHLKQEFHLHSKWFSTVVLFFLCLRLFWISSFPMTNDEVYYWEWSRHLQLSYIDAPPFVAWISFIGSSIFSGSFGARFLLPFIHIISTLFILSSAKKYAELHNSKLTNEGAICVLIFTQLTPVFNLEGIILLPDATLLLGISGSLFFLLKAFCLSKGNQNAPFSSKNALFFGFFLGISALSKYHALPIAIGFFLASFLIRFKTNKFRDLPFWIVTVIISICVSSPVFIWNIQNNFASFHFQSQHGFSDLSLDLKSFFRYLLGSLFYLYPWFFLLSFHFIIKSLKTKNKDSSFQLLSILPFAILFTLISYSALGKQALPHWAMPGFYLLIPAIAEHWKPLTGEKKKIWKPFIYISLILSTTLPTLASFQGFNKILIQSFIYFTGNADPLAQVYQWQTIQDDLKDQLNIKLKTAPYSNELPPENCTVDYQLASLRWYWTSQLAFHLKNQPRIFNFDFTNSSFYTWRDPLYKIAGCKFIILGSMNHFDESSIEKVMSIEYREEFSLSPYNENKIILIKGTMKNESILKEIYNKTKTEIRF